MPANTELLTGERVNYVLPKNSAVALIDLAPEFNWGHPCKHVIFDAETGEQYDSFDSQLPLSEFYTHTANFKTIQEEVKVADSFLDIKVEQTRINSLDIAIEPHIGDRYALLFSGMSNNRHVNDLEFMYRVLTDVYKFDPDKIIVLNYNGTLSCAEGRLDGPATLWPGDKTPYRMPVDGAGDKETLIEALEFMSNNLRENDLLFIHTNNHGDRKQGVSDLCCWPDWDKFDAEEFSEILKTYPKFKSLIVMMEQCHSGGFMDPIIASSKAEITHFSAACRADLSSYGGDEFDIFAYSWIAAINGKQASGEPLYNIADSNYDNRVSVSEAFEYAKLHKAKKDTPVTKSSHSGAGDILYLDDPILVLRSRNSKEFHRLGCSRGKKILKKNRIILGSPEEALSKGLNGCWYCYRKYDKG